MTTEHKPHSELVERVRESIYNDGEVDTFQYEDAIAALDSLVEQYETLHKAATFAEDELRKWGTGHFLVAARHRLHDALDATSSPASRSPS